MSKFEFKTDTPENQGMNLEILNKQWEVLKERNTHAYMVIRGDKIIFEKYAPDWDRNKSHYTASSAKAIVGGLALMLAVSDGYIDIDDFAHKYIPQWKDDPLKSKITIRHLASHTSGLEDADEKGVPHRERLGWKGSFWRQDIDPFLVSRDNAPVVFYPGTEYQYSNPGIAMLGYAITASLKDCEHKDIRTYLYERIIKYLDIPEEEWQIGYGKTFELDGLKLVPAWGGGGVSPNAMARIGRLLINKGFWNGTQLIDSKVVFEALKHAGTPAYHSYGFWVNSDLAGNKRWPSLTFDTVMALGAQDQMLLISPIRDLIVVRFGGATVDADGREEGWDKIIGKPLMDTMGDIAPCPRSTKITGINWAPPCTIVRLATGGVKRDGSDNWPITWAQDDNLYTAYGDGYGFDPHLPHKLGMGFAKITGMPDNFKCENIRSSAENTGYGGTGEKSSGLLCVDSTLYLWVRNADKNGKYSRLAKSTDYAKTWQWCDWVFEEFGHICFINYGKNYEGARDNYVYMVSHDNPSAYEVSDHFVLLRAPKDKLTDKSSYEFFCGLDEIDQPKWSYDVKGRKPILISPQKCRRSSISYNAGIGRYLWWHQLSSTGRTDTRFDGGLGIFEAPEPWGPWKTVYYTERWDVGAGDLACFPTKWMSKDGKTVYLVFAGDDNFALRKAELIVLDEK